MYGCRYIELVIISCAALLPTQRSGFEEPAIIRPEPDEWKPKVTDVIEGKPVSKPVPVVTLPRLLRSRAREIFDLFVFVLSQHFRPKDHFAFSRSQCDPDFSLNRTGAILLLVYVYKETSAVS